VRPTPLSSLPLPLPAESRVSAPPPRCLTLPHPAAAHRASLPPGLACQLLAPSQPRPAAPSLSRRRTAARARRLGANAAPSELPHRARGPLSLPRFPFPCLPRLHFKRHRPPRPRSPPPTATRAIHAPLFFLPLIHGGDRAAAVFIAFLTTVIAVPPPPVRPAYLPPLP
jgi:hypothetical protein